MRPGQRRPNQPQTVPRCAWNPSAAGNFAKPPTVQRAVPDGRPLRATGPAAWANPPWMSDRNACGAAGQRTAHMRPRPRPRILRLSGNDQAGTSGDCPLIPLSSVWRKPWAQSAQTPVSRKRLADAFCSRSSRHTSTARPSSAKATQNHVTPNWKKSGRRSRAQCSLRDASNAFAEKLHAVFPFIADHVSFSPFPAPKVVAIG